MAEFALQYKDEHVLSQPLTGAIFDILADLFHESLVERGLISREIEDSADIAEHDGERNSSSRKRLIARSRSMLLVFASHWKRRAT